MRVINLFGGPGVGKSTTAAGVFYHLKRQGVNCELVTEYAKDLVWDRSPLLKNQLHVLEEQERRVRRLRGKVEIVITDSPIIQGLAYVPPEFDQPWFEQAVLSLWGEYENRSYRLTRDASRVYQQEGRHVDEGRAKHYDLVIGRLCETHVPDALLIDTTVNDPVSTILEKEGFQNANPAN